jgi:hypothetical protein
MPAPIAIAKQHLTALYNVTFFLTHEIHLVHLIVNIFLTLKKDDEYKQYLFYSHLSSLEFDLVIKNESIQHCFIGKYTFHTLK